MCKFFKGSPSDGVFCVQSCQVGFLKILGFLQKGGTRLQLIRSSTLALCIFLYMRINLWVGKPNYCENTRLYFYFIDMALDDGKCWWAFSQILRLCSHTILFFQQINWLMLTGYAAVHCGPEYVWVLIAGARHLHPRVLHFTHEKFTDIRFSGSSEICYFSAFPTELANYSPTEYWIQHS